MARLTDEAIEAAVRELRDWSYTNGALTRRVTFPSFPECIAFVNRVAAIAEQVGHHPDIAIRYATIELTLTTHDAGGVTEKDLDMASRIDGALEQWTGEHDSA